MGSRAPGARLLRSLGGAVAAVVALMLVVAGCSSAQTVSNSQADAGVCPVSAVSVVVTTDVWASVVDQLAGQCANISTIVTSPSADPHEFEATAATSAAFAAAQLVIQNGLGYDSWANKIEASLGDAAPPVLDLGAAVGLKAGDNPHIWYSPTYVQQSAAAITMELKAALPAAAAYFDTAAFSFAAALQPYLTEISAIKSKYSGTVIGATESLFAYMAQATDLRLSTPVGFMNAEANGTDPTASDVATFRRQLSDGTDKVLIYNTQTQGGLPTAMRQLAEQSGVPVVNVTETLSPAGTTFQDWQLAQLQALSTALAK